MYKRRKFGLLTIIIMAIAIILFLCVKTNILTKTRFYVSGEGEEKVQNVIDMLNKGEKFVVIDQNDEGEFDHIVDVIYDSPELFWVDLRYYVLTVGDYKLLAVHEKYDNVDTKQRAIDVVVESIINSNITKDMSEYDKVVSVHDWLCDNLVYGENDDGSDQDIYGALVFKKARCAGYAKAFAYILNKVGVEAHVISGESYNKKGEWIEHAWNLIYIDGSPYYFDITWDDENDGDNWSYDWFAVSKDEFRTSHFPSSGYEWVETNSTAACYYIKNNMYLTECSVENIVSQIKKQGNEFTIKCSDNNVLQDVVAMLCNADQANQIIKNAGIQNATQIIYTENQHTNCLYIQIITEN